MNYEIKEIKVEIQNTSSSKKSDGSSPGKKKVKFTSEEKIQAPQSPEIQTQIKTKNLINFKKLDQDFEIPAENWTRERVMGVGAYGKVMECIYTPERQSFAVKRFEQIFLNEQRGTRLLREMKILSKVDHVCLNRLVSVFPPASELKDAYLVLEKCDMDMKKLLKSNKFLEEIQCKSIIYDILCGVNYLHKAHICHRDLKPENILVNDDCTIQICDFGLSRSLKDLPTDEIISIQEEDEEEKTPSSAQKKKYGKDDRPSLGIWGGNKAQESMKESNTKSMLIKSKTIENIEEELEPKKRPQLLKSKTSMLGVPKGKLKSKQLTKHVVTRWYRAPEVILAQDTYNYKIDVWSVGCIFAELLSMMRENFSHFTERKPLFPGESCLLLSPDFASKDMSMKEYAELDNKSDQLGIIFQVIGTPKPNEDLSFIKHEEAQRYVKCFRSCEPIDLQDMYPAAEPRGLELLQKMLKFNPNDRISAEEALKDPYFDDIRLEDQEEFEPCDIDLSFIENISNDQLSEMITETISQLSKNLDEDVSKFIQKHYE